MAEKENPGVDSTAENLEIGKERAKETRDAGFINEQLRERIKLLETTRKEQEKINAQISASITLARDMKTVDSEIYKAQTKLETIKNKLSGYDQKELSDIYKVQARLQKRYEIEKKREENTAKARKALAEYDVAKEGELLKIKLDGLKKAGKSEEEIRKEAEEGTKNILEREAALSKQLKTAELKEGLARKATLEEQKAIGPRKAALLLLLEAQKEEEKTLKALEKEKGRREDINKRIGITGLLAKGATNALAKIGMQSFADLEGLNKKMEEAASKGAGKWKILGIIGKHAVQSIGKALTDPAFILTSIVGAATALWKAAMNYEKHITDAAKSLGVNLSTAKELHHRFDEIADSNASLGMTGKDLMETYKGMNDQLGFMSNTNSEFLTTSAGLQRRLGLTANDMANVALFSEKTKKSTADTFNTIIGTAKAQMGKLKFAMSEKQVMEGIGKVSATVFNNFKGNVAQMAAAVVKATKLGTTLDEINNAGKSLLDFEGSISKEFEAQLLTGKNINLSKAREYALTGQTDKLMDEITKNLGSQAQWNQMNVMQQESLAEAMGMSKSQVDEMYKKQKLAGVLGKEAGADAATQYEKLKAQGKSHAEISELMGKDAAQQAIQASTQEKMAATMERISMAFQKIANELLQPIIEYVNKMFNSTDGVAHKMQSIVDTMKKIMPFAQGFLKTYLFIKGVMIAMKAYQGAMVLQQQAMVLYENRKKIAMVAQLGMAKLLHTFGIRRLANDRLEEISKARIAIKERIAAAIGAVRAGTQAAAASAGPTLGFGSLAVGAAVVGGLLAMLASAGGGGESGGAAGGTPTISEPKIEPMNDKAENAKPKYESMGTAKQERPVNNYVRVDPITGKALADVVGEQGSGDRTKYQRV